MEGLDWGWLSTRHIRAYPSRGTGSFSGDCVKYPGNGARWCGVLGGGRRDAASPAQVFSRNFQRGKD